MNNTLRQLGNSAISVSPLALGCWPISGMTSLNVTEEQSLATLEASLDLGINFFDTAYNYGRNGESERLIAKVARGRREKLVIASKGGLFWNEAGKQQHDGSPAALKKMCETSLARLETDYIDVWYLHAPDPNIPVAESAGGIRELLDSGKIRAAGISNASVPQMEAFQSACPLAVLQPHYNILQRDIEASQLPYCREHNIAVAAYWPLMKGFLAGKLPRSHVFASGDGRAKYPMFQGEEWQKNQDFLDDLRPIAAAVGKSLAAVVLNWTIHQPGITCALVGAKRPDQIEENAMALGWQLTPDQTAQITAALARRGTVVSQAAVR